MLFLFYRNLKQLPNGIVLEPHFSKIIKNKPKAVCSNDFEMLKVIGKGGFSKVYMGNQLLFKMRSQKKRYGVHLCNESHEERLSH